MAKASSKAKKQLRQDPVLAPLVARIKLEPLELTNDIYFRLLRTIVFQQLSGKAAATIFGRFTERFADGYPHAELLLGMDENELRDCGLSRGKSQYVRNVAEYFVNHDLLRQDWSRVSDQRVIEQLTAIKGVGHWTAQIILMFTLGRKDIFPIGDLAIRQSLQELYRLTGKGKQLDTQMLKIAKAWSPYRTVACRYLWHWRDELKGGSV